MRGLGRLVCVFALATMGCSETSGTGGAAGGGGGGMGGQAGIGGAPGCTAPADCFDPEECTLDSCMGGVCHHAPVDDGTECAGGEGVCVLGTCRALCETSEQCGDDLNDCTVDACVPEKYCDRTDVEDGTECAGGTCQSGECALSSAVLPCTEQGIRNATAAGGGPYTFDCDGPTTVETKHGIIIDNDVILDGEGLLLLGGAPDAFPASIVRVRDGTTAELRGFVVNIDVPGDDTAFYDGISNDGTTVVANSLITNETGSFYASSISNGGTVLLSDSTVDARIDNSGRGAITIANSTVKNTVNNRSEGSVAVVNSTVVGNSDISAFAIWNELGPVTIASSTLSWRGGALFQHLRQNIHVGASLLDGECAYELDISNGYNIESPGNTCGFDPSGTDRVNVSADDLKLGALADNGGPTETHALGEGSVAIDQIPEAECVDAEGQPLTTDQRGEPRDSMCDVGAFEVQP